MCLQMTMLLTLTGLARGGNLGRKIGGLAVAPVGEMHTDTQRPDPGGHSCVDRDWERQKDVWLTQFTALGQNVVIAKKI